MVVRPLCYEDEEGVMKKNGQRRQSICDIRNHMTEMSLHICCMNSSSETLDFVCRSFSLARGSGCGHTDVTVTSVPV